MSPLTSSGPSQILRRAAAYWKVSRYSGTGDLLDLSGNGHHLTPNNSPLYVAASGGVPAHFALTAASSHYLETGDADNLDSGSGVDFTLVVVLRSALLSGTTVGCIAAKKAGNTSQAGYGLFVSSVANRITGQIANGTSSVTPTADKTGQDNIILPVALRRTGGTVRVIFNGTSGTAQPESLGSLASTTALTFGRMSGGTPQYATYHFFGAGLFRYALTDTEVARVGQEVLTNP
jgi:hypothetical protein